ncbi:hypothetical protein [Coralloluteibacterium thermophilus]|uniref:Uncharacterized protein n=1 Tax=Coralloluteibacterium thermophilum TaxID=2707049 RepID=A0ABV9NKS9_9GAMM
MPAPTGPAQPAPRAPAAVRRVLTALVCAGVLAPATAKEAAQAADDAGYRTRLAPDIASAHAPGVFDACGIRFALAPEQVPEAQGEDFILFNQIDDGEAGALVTCLAEAPPDPEAALRAYSRPLAGDGAVRPVVLDANGRRYTGVQRSETQSGGRTYGIEAWYLPSSEGGAMLMLFATQGPAHVAAREAFRARLQASLVTDVVP